MTRPGDLNQEAMSLAASISERLRHSGGTVSSAESLTSGALSCHLAASRGSSDWFLGGIVAYASEVKYAVLGVDRGPVVTASAARQMAAGVARLTGSDFAVAVTGVGGPEEEEGRPVGTVFIAVHSASEDRASEDSASGHWAEEHHFSGEPDQIVDATILRALEMLDAEIQARWGRA